MAIQWIRKVSLLVVATDEVLDLSDFRFTFVVSAYFIGNPKSIQLRVYNVSDDTAKKVKDAGGQVILSAGYEGNFSSIFDGSIVQVRIGRESGTDTYLDISGLVLDEQFSFMVMNFSVAAGTTGLGRLGKIAQAVGVTTGTIQSPQDAAKLHRGRVYFGMAADHLDGLCATMGAYWTMSDGVLDVVSSDSYISGEIPVLTSHTGMIGFPEQMDEGIAIKALLNPSIKQNMSVQVDNRSIQQYQYPLDVQSQQAYNVIPPLSADGIYKVLHVSHSGDTRGQEWYTDIVCYNSGHPPLNAAQYSIAGRVIY